MAAFSQEQIIKFIRGISIRQIRLACGLVLFAYLVSHFLNHALGNISMDALATGVYYHTAFWQFLPVAIVFYTAALVHAGLGIWALYERRQFRWKAVEPLQLVLGLSIPALVITHIVGVRLGHTLFGHEKLYPQVFFAYWIVWPYKMWLIFAVLTISWIHGCIGLYFWLRMKAFFERAAPTLLGGAVLTMFRERFSQAITAALLWVVVGLVLVIAYSYRFELHDVADRVLVVLVPGHVVSHGRSVEIGRGNAGDFSITAQINGARVAMVLDTGASSVVLTREDAKAAGLPLEVLNYTVNIDTANGRARAAPVTLDRIAIGGLVERSVEALVAQPGQLKMSLLGMSFLNRLQSWQVSGDRLVLQGYP